jgi:hypothetical protein
MPQGPTFHPVTKQDNKNNNNDDDDICNDAVIITGI